MTQPIIGLITLLFMMIPPVAEIMESIMILHMHMQMPMIVIAGFLMAPFFTKRFPNFFSKWNQTGIPGMLLFIIVMSYWSIPRAMDDALTYPAVELFKFISLAFLVGVPLRDSWKKISNRWQNGVLIFFFLQFTGLGILYIAAPGQLCNNYIQSEQVTLGWGFLTIAIAILVYLVQLIFINPADYE
ncbi:hypothetical protein [Ornithinibacillus halophilus]|nr:hypothetical protein [Ornithinibacillus halophilus]